MIVLDGVAYRDEKIKEIREYVYTKLKTKPKLMIITSDTDYASKKYANIKMKIAKKCLIESALFKINTNQDRATIINKIQFLFKEYDPDGAIIQLPFSNDPVFDQELCNLIPPEKDVDGLSSYNQSKLLKYGKDDLFFKPCTPEGILNIIRHYNLEGYVKNEDVVIYGRSKLVGTPLALMLMNEFNCSPKIIHSKSYNYNVGKPKLVVYAVGKPHITETLAWTNSNDIVFIDVGINELKGKIVGDLKVNSEVKAYTPVPGGVGPMTVITLMEHVVRAVKTRLYI